MGNKTVLITGCSSGFGKLAAKTFHRNGWNVVATMRAPEKETELTATENMLITKLDVTDEQSIHSAITHAMEKFGRIDALINNAGYGGYGLFEQFDHADISKMFDTNVFGPMRVTKAVLPIMRQQHSGAIINITSTAALTGLPCTSVYCASKFAITGWSEGIRIECKPFNIKVKTILPGAFGTHFSAATDNRLNAGDDQVSQLANGILAHFTKLQAARRQQEQKPADPQDVADMIYMCVTEDTPTHNLVGKDAVLVADMKNSMPHQAFLDLMTATLLPE